MTENLPPTPDLAVELGALRARLAEAEEVLNAIRQGGVDAVMVSGGSGEQVYSLRGADIAYRKLVETMSEGAATLSMSGVMLYCNAALAKLLERSPEDVVGTALRTHLSIADRPAFDALLARSRTEPSRSEIALATSSGRQVPVYLSASLLRSDEADPVFCLVLTDLTGQRSAERIAAAERLARSILEQVAEAIVVCDEQGRVSRASNAAVRLCDGSPVLRLFDEAFPLRVDASGPFSVAPVLRGETVHNADVALDRSGTTLDLILNAGPLLRGERIVGCVVTLTDITERRRGESALRLKSAALEATANSIVITNRDGVIEWANAAFSDLTGFSPEESVGRKPGELLKSGYHDPAFYEQMWKTIVEGGVWRGEIVNKKKDGGIYTEDMTITPLKDTGGVITHFIAVKQDITQRNVLADQLRQAQRLESVGRLAGGVAHDFNNMLAVILGNAELALRRGDPSPILREYVSGIHTAGLRSADLTRQLLAFARKQIITPKVLDLNDAVALSLKMLRRLIGEDITLTWRPTAERLPIMMDSSQLDQILTNLSINARDAITGVGTLDFSTNRRVVDAEFCETHAEAVPGDCVQLTVADSGRGMTKETLSRIFEPFFTTKGIGEGTGLGLATIYGAVTQNHGFIAVSSVPGRGTTFEIYFPRLDDPVLPEPTRDILAPLPRGHETILLVEDEIAVLRLTSTTLEAQGYTVLLAHGATEAIRMAETHGGAIDLLLTDVVMPEMNGHDLAKTLASTRPALKRLFMSGYTANIMQGQGTTLDQAPFIAKPFTLLALTEKVRAVLDGG